MAIYNFQEKKPKKNNSDYQKISGIICVAVSVLALFCLITHFVPFAKNFLLGIFGLFCYPFFITCMAIGFALIGHKKYVMPKKYIILLSLSILFVLCILQLMLVGNNDLSFWQYIGKCYSQKTTAGGIVVGFITAPVLYILNKLGAYIIFVALAVIFIALTVDYMHYLSKNENLKKSIKISTKQQSELKNITVKELEKNLKESKQQSDQPKEKVLLTLNAKIKEENEQDSAKKKLGLLASSKVQEDDNTRYFDNELKKQQIAENPREYILTKYSDAELSEKANLSRVQENLMDLKSKANLSSYAISSSNYTAHNANLDVKEEYNASILLDNNGFERYKQNTVAPKQVIHDNSSEIINQNATIEEKSSIVFNNENQNNFVKEEPQKQTPQVSIIEDGDIVGGNIKDAIDRFKQVQSPAQEEKPSLNTMDVESFSTSVLASLRAESKPIEEAESTTYTNMVNSQANTVSYQTTENLFVEEKEQLMHIVPKPQINYAKPPIELLTTESMDLSLVSKDVEQKTEELEQALETFGIPARVIGVVIGPAVTRYELEMPAGISIKRLLAIQDDIAYNLSSNGDIRIEAPIPGRRAVGIEVPNEKIATVGLKDIIMSREFMESKTSLAIALGKDISGMIKTFSLVKIPHLLIAGTTGSGKSVCINAIILSLIYKYSPDEVKFILVDPKRVEFSMYNHLPHLIMPNVITDNEKALNALSWCVDEMERRYIVFANARVKNMEEYNESEEVLEGKAQKMPYIIFIIDELADLLMTAKKEAEEHICRILQKARAAGIHMILATQRPSVDVVTGKIKANLNARICFALMTSADSKTVLDQGGADKLLGKGDMLFMSSDTGVPKRIQGCFVTTKEIDDVVTYIKENNGDYDFDAKTEQAIVNPPKNDVIAQIDDKAPNDGFDMLMPQVLKSVIDSGHASISMIQRKFLVGFPRAARIIDQMEEAGYISPSDGSKSRSVYITMEEYEKLYGNE